MAIKILLVVILAVWVGMQLGRLVTLRELEEKTGCWKITKYAPGKAPEVSWLRQKGKGEENNNV